MIRVKPLASLALFASLLGTILINPLEVSAQSINFADGNDKSPLEIYADNGIEWQQDKKLIIAVGNANAIRGNVKVEADELRAFYEDGAGGAFSNIHRLEAVGKVKIASPKETVTGDRAVYDLVQAIMVVSGGNPTLQTPEDTIRASGTLEYWENKSQAVARGNAVAIRGDKKIKADILAALFRKDRKGDSTIQKVNAFGKVTITTPNENITADKGVYEVASAVVTLSGDVTIVRGGSVLKGCSAVVNLNTNISRIKSCEGDGRVRGIVSPTEKP